MKFRNLRADEIECRISFVRENFVSLLLYKDARVDQNILDETVGAMNWQRHHSRDNANCIISIWDEEKKQWIEKEDTGTESATEKEKGIASDSFKRSGFNWGIGRELYTAPRIYISDCNIKSGKCYDRFSVSEILTLDGKINVLVIRNDSLGKDVFWFGKKPDCREEAKEEPKEEQKGPEKGPEKIDSVKATVLRKKIAKKGLAAESIEKHYKSEVEQMTLDQWKNAMDILDKYKDRSES